MTRMVANLLKTTIFSSLLLVLSGSVNALPMLYDVRYNPISNSETELQLVFDEQLNLEPKVSVLNEPARLELFFSGAEFEESLQQLKVNKAGIKQIQSSMVKDGFIVTIEMDQLKLYKTQVKNNLVYLQISENPIYEASESAEQGAGKLTHHINRIQSIDFRRGEKGEAKVLVFLESSQAAIDV
jgi:type IV pilus assembly protein PilQ